jgi:hypothetical protein
MLLFALNNWRVLVMGTIVLALGTGLAFYKWRANVWEGRYETEKAAFQAFKSQVAALASAAETKAKETKARQDTTTRKVAGEYKDSTRRISDYYGSGLRLPASGSGGRELPAPADSAQSPDAAPEERAASGPSVADCALDAAQVMAFQQWVRDQGLPVAD